MTDNASRERTFLRFLLFLALIRGLLYLSVVPPWEHHDEPTHFEYAWLIANRSALPQRGDYDQDMRREVAASMIEHRFPRLHNLGYPDLGKDGPIWIGISELGHPPFYYLLAALPLRLVRHSDIPAQLYLARLVSLILYLCSIWVGYRLVGELAAPGHPLRRVVPGTMALLPAYTNLMTAVNNDVGAVVVFALFLWGAVRMIRRGFSWLRLLWLVGTAALCVWTKNTASVAIVLLPLALALALFRQVRKGWLWAGFLAAGVSLVFALFTWGDRRGTYLRRRQAPPAGAHRVRPWAAGRSGCTLRWRSLHGWINS